MGSHVGGGVFKDLYVYKDGEILKFEDKEMKVDTIYHYNNLAIDAEFNFGSAKIINSVLFRTFGADKFKQYELLRDFFPETRFLETKEDVVDYVDSFKKEELIVLKPCRGASGSGVIVARAGDFSIEQIDQVRLGRKGYLGQYFMDTSIGIPGVANGTHDMRIMTMIDKIVLCHVRIPVEGSLIGNTHKGASMKEVYFEDLPKQIKDFYFAVHAKIKEKFPQPLYSLDLGLTPDGPLLFEINAHTAFPRKDFSVFDSFIQTLLDTLDM